MRDEGQLTADKSHRVAFVNSTLILNHAKIPPTEYKPEDYEFVERLLTDRDVVATANVAEIVQMQFLQLTYQCHIEWYTFITNIITTPSQLVAEYGSVDKKLLKLLDKIADIILKISEENYSLDICESYVANELQKLIATDQEFQETENVNIDQIQSIIVSHIKSIRQIFQLSPSFVPDIDRNQLNILKMRGWENFFSGLRNNIESLKRAIAADIQNNSSFEITQYCEKCKKDSEEMQERAQIKTQEIFHQLQRSAVNGEELKVAEDTQNQAAQSDQMLALVDAVDNFGNSALHYAVQHRHKKLVWLLIKNGARFDVANYFGKKPLDENAEWLLDLVDENGLNLLHWTVVNSQPESFNQFFRFANEKGKITAILHQATKNGQTPLEIEDSNGNNAFHLMGGCLLRDADQHRELAAAMVREVRRNLGESKAEEKEINGIHREFTHPQEIKKNFAKQNKNKLRPLDVALVNQRQHQENWIATRNNAFIAQRLLTSAISRLYQELAECEDDRNGANYRIVKKKLDILHVAAEQIREGEKPIAVIKSLLTQTFEGIDERRAMGDFWGWSRTHLRLEQSLKENSVSVMEESVLSVDAEKPLLSTTELCSPLEIHTNRSDVDMVRVTQNQIFATDLNAFTINSILNSWQQSINLAHHFEQKKQNFLQRSRVYEKVFAKLESYLLKEQSKCKKGTEKFRLYECRLTLVQAVHRNLNDGTIVGEKGFIELESNSDIIHKQWPRLCFWRSRSTTHDLVMEAKAEAAVAVAQLSACLIK